MKNKTGRVLNNFGMPIFAALLVFGLLSPVFCLPASGMGLFRPQTKNIDTSKAVAEINADTTVNATKQALEQPPVSVSAGGSNNKIEVSVLPNETRATVKNSANQTGGTHQLQNSDDSSAFTLGQKLILLALGLGALLVLLVSAWRYFKSASPAIAAAVSGLASVADQAGATAINNLRLKLAAAENPEAQLAYQHAIAEIEAARGKTAAAAPAQAKA